MKLKLDHHTKLGCIHILMTLLVIDISDGEHDYHDEYTLQVSRYICD